MPAVKAFVQRLSLRISLKGFGSILASCMNCFDEPKGTKMVQL